MNRLLCGAPATLRLTAISGNDATFSADPPSQTVKPIRYWQPTEASLQADIVVEEVVKEVVKEDDIEDAFSLSFEKMPLRQE